uniref:S4 domain-containing protein n=1 Tax=Rheinheimera sp. TaxID=1869214 RepID=UPI0040474B31
MTAPLTHRLAKYIAQSGYCSRRAAERLITQGRVSLNGNQAKHTDLVSSADLILIDQHKLTNNTSPCYLAYHKPVGVDCNNRPGRCCQYLSAIHAAAATGVCRWPVR